MNKELQNQKKKTLCRVGEEGGWLHRKMLSSNLVARLRETCCRALRGEGSFEAGVRIFFTHKLCGCCSVIKD